MAVYEKCDEEIHRRVETILKRWHLQRLGLKAPCDLTVGCLFFRAKRDVNGVIIGPPLRLHGYDCATVIKINALKLRAQGLPDAEITIDEDALAGYSQEMQTALLDHELEHVETVRTAKGEIKEDDLGRPRLHLKLHDWHLGGFKVIAERHREHAIELRNAQKFAAEYGQLLFPFAAADAGKSQRQKAEEFLNRDKPFTEQVAGALDRMGVT